LSALTPIRVFEEQENKEPTASTSEMPAKDPPKVKLVIEESLIVQKCES